eukprot:3306261-Prymnesium_polylepis.1
MLRHADRPASWKSLSGYAGQPSTGQSFESCRDDWLASVRMATGYGVAVGETLRKHAGRSPTYSSFRIQRAFTSSPK